MTGLAVSSAINEELKALSLKIKRIIFKAKDDSGYVVAVGEPIKGGCEINVVGTLPEVKESDVIQANGYWSEHPKYGRQFMVRSYDYPDSNNRDGIVAYLASLPGISSKTASLIYDTFGADIYEVLDSHPERLLEIKGIGEYKKEKIIESYKKNRGLYKLISFLGSMGISANYANPIYKEFGENSINQLKRNPYSLLGVVRSFGFKRCDELALKLDIAPDSFIRFEAAVIDVLKTGANRDGHSFLWQDNVVEKSRELLELPNFTLEKQHLLRTLEKMAKSRQLKIDGERVYLWRNWDDEQALAHKVMVLSGLCPPIQADLEAWLKRWEEGNGIKLEGQQREAVAIANQNRFIILTGGAGCGKSTTAKAIVSLWASKKQRNIVVCAPTGRAAQRVKEISGYEAQTIHRLLEWQGNGFTRNEDFLLNGEFYLIDEAAMCSTNLLASLFRAIPPSARVCLIGDHNQLLPIGAGMPFRDLIDSKAVPVVRLERIFRQGNHSNIVSCAHAINHGEYPSFEDFGLDSQRFCTDALLVRCNQKNFHERLTWLLEKLKSLGYKEEEIQILSPMNRGDTGNEGINALVQALWNRTTQQFGNYRVGDRVIQTTNNYDRDIFNGDIGIVETINLEDKVLSVRFGNKTVQLDQSDLDNLKLAYSITVHKSQGSEFPVVILPMLRCHYFMLERNLLYTGLTRAKKLVIMLGEEDIIRHAVRTIRSANRNTSLVEALQTGESLLVV